MALQSTTALATITLQAAASEVTFNGIPNTYRDLVLVFSGDGSSGGADISIRLNSDTGNNYNRVFMIGNGSTTASGSTAGTSRMDAHTVANGRQLSLIAQFIDASATDKHKVVLTRDNDSGFQVGARAFRWANTSAITSLQVLVSGGTFNVGSTFSLYGRIA